MIWSRVPVPLRSLYPGALWAVKTGGRKEVYLTFDDGPSIIETGFVLTVLEQFNAKACFFLIGKNAIENPELVKKIVADGHGIGNHTFSHKNGWKTGRHDYLDNVLMCHEIIPSKLFRPPYGKILPSQANILKKAGFKLVMWDLLSYDFDPSKSVEEILDHLKRKVKAGSIVVFHDSAKAFPLLKVVLPAFMEYCQKEGYLFKALETKI
jgi:peptidoglycan-N-acetylglucosamine deacetylase